MNAVKSFTGIAPDLLKTEADRHAIRDQLERILSHPLFRNSKRYPALLRYVVEKHLENPSDHLKERIIGSKVFGREPDYDTNLDHSVRTCAGEVRKLLAQYYLESDRQNEIRITLPPGSYVPQFIFPAAVEQTNAATSDAVVPTTSHGGISSFRRFQLALLILALAGVCGIIASLVMNRPQPESALDQFWDPVTGIAGPVAICIGAAGGYVNGVKSDDSSLLGSVWDVHMQREKVAFDDAVTMARLAGFLQTKAKTFRVLYAPRVMLSDLRQGPIVLVGAFDNEWTLRLTGRLRYTFHRDPEFNISRIVDSQNPDSKQWQIDWRRPDLELTEDYSLVTRVYDSNTGETMVVAAGMTKYGTLAAGEFLTSSRMNEVNGFAPRDWKRKNLQLVLGTKVIKGSSGPPRILAAHFW